MEGLFVGELDHAVGELDLAARALLDMFENVEDLGLQDVTADDYIGLTLRYSSPTLGVNAEYRIDRDIVLKASATRQQ